MQRASFTLIPNSRRLLSFILGKIVVTNKNLNENTFLEWEVPRKAWHITEARWFSPSILALIFVIGFAFIFTSIAIAMKLHPPDNVDNGTLTFTKLPAFSAGISAFCVALYASSWWWARLKAKLTSFGIERTYHNSTRTWKFERIKSYNFEPLHSKNDVYTLVVLRSHKGKIWKIALDESVDKTKIEETLNKHGIPKLEQIT